VQAQTKGTQRTWVVYAGFLAAVAALVIFAWLAESVLRGQTLRLDGFVRGTVHSWATPGLTAVLRSITQLGSARVLITFCVVLIASLLWTGRKRAAMVFAIGASGSELLNELLKQLFHRARPDPFFGFAEPPDYSFPSGHAVMSCCIYGVAAAIVTTRIESHLGKVLVWAGAALLAALIGLSRIYLGVHYPSDVIAGFAAAIVWVTALWVAYGAWLRRFS
jgi:membrane-associated phospholipid phosphatase